MCAADPRIEAFFSEAKAWRAELEALRAILLDQPLAEEFKWNGPCYTAEGGNVATLWGLKDACAIGFFKGALMKDPEGILAAPGENSRAMRTIRFADAGEIERLRPVLAAYLREAVEVERAGLKVEFAKDDIEPPEELTRILEADPKLRAAFEALTPGRRRAYLLHFTQPKKSGTRVARIERASPAIMAGKGMHDR